MSTRRGDSPAFDRLGNPTHLPAIKSGNRQGGGIVNTYRHRPCRILRSFKIFPFVKDAVRIFRISIQGFYGKSNTVK